MTFPNIVWRGRIVHVDHSYTAHLLRKVDENIPIPYNLRKRFQSEGLVKIKKIKGMLRHEVTLTKKGAKLVANFYPGE